MRRTPADRETCFNPCFDGSEARATSILCWALAMTVSILVLMEVKRERVEVSETDAKTAFQSLF